MIKNYFKDFFIIGTSSVISILLSLLTTPIITRIVSPHEYGAFSLFLLYGQTAIFILALGLDQSLIRYFYKVKYKDYKNYILYKCLKWPVLFYILFSFLLLLLKNNFNFDKKTIVYLLIYIFLLLIYRFAQLIVRLEFDSGLFSKLNIIQKIIYIIIALPAIYLIKNFYLQILIISTLIALLICTLVAIYKYIDIWNIKEFLHNKKCFIKEKILLNYAYPYFISFIILSVFNTSDRVILNLYTSYFEIGIYASALSLISILNLIQSTFNTLWAPFAVKHFTDFPDDKELYIKANKIITVVMFCIGIVLILCKDLFVLLLGDKYREASYLLPCLIFNPIMYTISETTVLGLVFMQKSKAHTLVALGSAITNIVLCFALIPFLGIKGAAIANALAYIVFFSIRTYLSNKYFKVEYDLKKFYVLTFSCLFFALYNTFMLINVLSYIFCIFILLLIWYLYKDTVVFIIQYARKLLPFDV